MSTTTDPEVSTTGRFEFPFRHLIIDNWAEFRPKFRKVMPIEYRRALQEMERQRMGLAAE